ncbi:MAG TPA: hypothetical protein VII62_20365 [Vicinamibacteria bacterium]|jgi:ElaB/YqjD/DUF883 family membrane-anchored ribosome-binding protein
MQEPRVLSGTETEDVSRIGREWAEGEERAKEVGRRAREEAAETLRAARAKVSRAYDRTADSAVRTYRGARDYAQAHPGAAAAMSFAAGVGIGMMVSAQNGATYRRGLIPRGLIPVAAIALAHAVLDVFEEAR